MSRTDKTAPQRVKVHFAPEYLREVHDHTRGDCDLPPKPKVGTQLNGWNELDQRCIWDYSFAYYRSAWARCGCDMCGYDAFQVPRRRRQRIEGKKLAKNWRDEY